jgi:DNA-binding transcriptional LysR family regulator/predicted ATPase
MDVEPRLRAFAAVAREGSFSQAAARLYVSQPAISKHVASLESELGTQLVDRGRRGARLTPAGELLADYVLRAEALLANGRRALEAGGDAETGTLALAASGIPGTYLLPTVLSRFHEDHPGVELQFELSTSAGALELVRAHRVELAVVGGLEIPHELEGEPLVEDEVVLIGPPAFGGRRLRPTDLEGQTWIFREEGSATRAAVEAARWQIGLRTARTLELPSWESVKLAVAAGAGIAAISRYALGLELDTGTVAVLDVPRWRLSRTISVVKARDVPLTPPAGRFLVRLRGVFRQTPAAALGNTNLAPPPSPLIGRRDEVSDVIELVRSTRLVTLTGAGGSGKTRLAAEVAGRLVDDFADGVYFVDLAPLREAGLVLPFVAQTLDVVPPERLLDALAERRLLLVLDNFEHLLDGSAAVAAILERARHVKLLLTSRVVLGLRAEHAYEVMPLTLLDAAALFAARARAVAPEFKRDSIVEQICRRLDCLPLAIELAAARCGVLSSKELLERLEQGLGVLASGPQDAAARQRTLDATVQWSYDLLSADARSALARLSVFAGGCSLDAAEQVCLATPETMSELVEHNLLRRVDDRFGMLDTIHRHGTMLLDASSEGGVVSRRHAEYFAAFCEEAAPHLRGGDQTAWLARLRLEAANVRAAVAWSDEAGDRELQLRIVGASWQYLTALGARDEWRKWLEAALAAVDEPRLRLRGLAPLSWLALAAGDLEAADAAAEERAALGRSTGDQHHVAGGYSVLAEVALARGDVERARELGQLVVAVDRQLGDDAAVAVHLANLAGLLIRSGDLPGARPLLEKSAEIALRRGDDVLVGETQFGLATIALREGHPQDALRLARDGAPSMLVADMPQTWTCVEILGAALVGVGRARDGTRLLGAAEDLRRSARLERLSDLVAVREQALAEASAELGPRAVAIACAEGVGLDLAAAVEIATAD